MIWLKNIEIIFKINFLLHQVAIYTFSYFRSVENEYYASVYRSIIGWKIIIFHLGISTEEG